MRGSSQPGGETNGLMGMGKGQKCTNFPFTFWFAPASCTRIPLPVVWCGEGWGLIRYTSSTSQLNPFSLSQTQRCISTANHTKGGKTNRNDPIGQNTRLGLILSQLQRSISIPSSNSSNSFLKEGKFVKSGNPSGSLLWDGGAALMSPRVPQLRADWRHCQRWGAT